MNRKTPRSYRSPTLAAVLGLALLAGSYLTSCGTAPALESAESGGLIRVPAGEDLQAAIDRARSGDVIELEAGAVYREITLPNKPFTEFVTIRSSAIARLPENTRVEPRQASLMARIATRGKGDPAVKTMPGAHHFRFVGIEFTSLSPDYVYNLIDLGTGAGSLADVPHSLEIDRSLIRSGGSTASGVVRRGLALNSANTAVTNSYFEGFAFPQEETQGICGWSGTRNVRIVNNYIEGGAENVMFGGSDPARAEMTPEGIEITGNHLSKPAAWKGRFSVKTLFELKNAKRVRFAGNYLENNWVGSALRITVRNQDGSAPYSTIEDVEIRDNLIDGAGEGINILGRDDTYESRTLKGLTIVNNLFLNIGADGFEGSGYFFQIADGENITIANNTVFNSGNTATFYGTAPRSLIVRDNIIGHGNYGIHGLTDVRSADAQRIFRNNLIVNNRGVGPGDTSFPPGNVFVGGYQAVGFADLARGDLKLAAGSKFKSRVTGGGDPGCDPSTLPRRR